MGRYTEIREEINKTQKLLQDPRIGFAREQQLMSRLRGFFAELKLFEKGVIYKILVKDGEEEGIIYLANLSLAEVTDWVHLQGLDLLEYETILIGKILKI